MVVFLLDDSRARGTSLAHREPALNTHATRTPNCPATINRQFDARGTAETDPPEQEDVMKALWDEDPTELLGLEEDGGSLELSGAKVGTRRSRPRCSASATRKARRTKSRSRRRVTTRKRI